MSEQKNTSVTDLSETVDVLDDDGSVIARSSLQALCNAVPVERTGDVITELLSVLTKWEASEIVVDHLEMDMHPLHDAVEEAISLLRRRDPSEALLVLERAFYPSMTEAHEAARLRGEAGRGMGL
ncbi:MAG TPA: hypothetical protein VHL98_10975 [Microvirga sp.]|jgi:hypothetical protein|nr:hypothetical protein [Microvirga sp.]